MTKPVDPKAPFSLEEYKVISQYFSSAFSTMAVLLSLFFVYTAAVLVYISHLFDGIKPVNESARVCLFFHLDFLYVQIFVICFISIVFTFWSHCWVSVYRSGAAMTLSRASELEAQLSHADRRLSFFNSYALWYRSEKWLVRLYYATAIFFVSVYAVYFLIAVYALTRLVCPT
jgi:hypothetical protein